MLTKALTLFLLPALAAAQYGYAPPSTPSDSSAAAASPTTSSLAVAPTAPSDANTPGQMNIDVAFNHTFVFNPPNITAPVGTLVTFWFPNFGLNHSVTQSTFQNPCTYLAANASSSTPGGFDSGLLSASNFTINITDTKPIWFFCKQVMHCGLGMVGSINAPTTENTFDAFKTAALAIGGSEMTTPDGIVIGGVGANATGPPVPDLPTTSTPSGAMKVTTSIGFALFAAALGVAMA